MATLVSHTEKGAVVAITRDGRVIAQGEAKYIVTSRTGCIAINVRVPDLRMVEYVLNVQFSMTDFACATNYLIGPDMNKKISGNVVGMSLYVATTGTTLTAEVIAIGPP